MDKLSDKDFLKLVDLCRVYGRTGVSDIICVDRDEVELGLQPIELENKVAKNLRSGIKRYWKGWMGRYREK